MADRNSPKTGAAGPLDALGTNPFTFDSLVYPSDIESLAHCMTFNINVSDRSKDIKGIDGVKAEAIAPDTQSRSQKVRAGTELGSSLFGLGTQRKTKRIKKAISLYVPETMIFDQRQEYFTPSTLQTQGYFYGEGLKMAGTVAGVSAAVLGTAIGSIEGLGVGIIPGAIGGVLAGLAVKGTANFVGQKLEDFTNNFGSPGSQNDNILTEVTGYAVNPMIEVVYGTPNLRTFQFDFSFAPRSAQEADNVWNIIQTFREYQAPEFAGSGKGFSGIFGAFFVPPAEFDITFFRQDDTGSFVQNNNIPGISTCVLTESNTNYAPENQWVTFKDGMPVHITLRLVFMEIDIITRERIRSGF